jgi:hypothetical protein
MTRRPNEQVLRFKAIQGGKAPAGAKPPLPPPEQDVLAVDSITKTARPARLYSGADGEPLLVVFGWPA